MSISDAFQAHEILSLVFDRCQEHDIGSYYRAALWRADYICIQRLYGNSAPKKLRAAIEERKDDIWNVAVAPRDSTECKHIAPRVSQLDVLMRQDQSQLTPLQIVGETGTQLLAMPSVGLDGSRLKLSH